MTSRSGAVGRVRAVLATRELLARCTWDDLNRIAARHNVALSGRRRELAVDRLAAVLERPDQIRAAEGIVSPIARGVLGLLLLLQSADDERHLQTIRDALSAARPDLQPLWARAHIGNELQTLVALGLLFRDRRRLNVPREVLDSLTPISTPATLAAPPATAPQSYAQTQYLLEQLVAGIERTEPIAIPPPVPNPERATAYHALALPPEEAATLGAPLGVSSADVALLIGILGAAGASEAVRGRWKISAGWRALREQAPRHLWQTLISAWLKPRIVSDTAATRRFAWLVAPDADGAALIAAHEAQLRSIVWRWIGWCGTGAWSIASLAETLAAVHAPLLVPDDRALALTVDGRNAPLDPADAPRVAHMFVQTALTQLARLGLIVHDDQSAMLTPGGAWLLHNAPQTSAGPAISSTSATTLRVHPLLAAPRALSLITLAGTPRAPDGEWARYEWTAHGIGRLLEQHAIVDVEQALTEAGAELAAPFRAQLHAWAERAGRVRLHHPLTLIVTAPNVPLAQVLNGAGLGDAAEVIGPGCALIEPERVDAALEQLQARGFWPRIIGKR